MFFEIKILISKSPVSNILRGTSQIQIQQLSCNQYFAQFDPKNRGRGVYPHKCSEEEQGSFDCG